jgi:hypothetical protein
MIKLGDHPIKIMEILEDKYPYDSIIAFIVKYLRKPWCVGRDKVPLISDESHNIQPFSLEYFSEGNALEDMLSNTDPGYDLSLRSSINILDEHWVHHIPMIDFNGKLSRWHLESLRDTLSDDLLEDLYLFDSGNSMHGYILKILTHTEWVEFMGTLLLTEYREKPKVVDTRWVGHSLRRGYGSLRWSASAEKYKYMPVFIGKFTDLERSF